MAASCYNTETSEKFSEKNLESAIIDINMSRLFPIRKGAK